MEYKKQNAAGCFALLLKSMQLKKKTSFAVVERRVVEPIIEFLAFSVLIETKSSPFSVHGENKVPSSWCETPSVQAFTNA